MKKKRKKRIESKTGSQPGACSLKTTLRNCRM
jgi:hypothetical protein